MLIKKYNINPDLLKIYALFSMTVDHLSNIFSLPGEFYIRLFIGRLSFPIFSVLLMYHLFHEQIYEKYADRLLFFGIVTLLLLFPFHFEISLNVLFTFLFPVLALWGIHLIQCEKINFFLSWFLKIGVILLMALFSKFAQYSFFGYFYLLSLYAFFSGYKYVGLAGILFFSFYINYNSFIGYGIISVLATLFLLNVDMEKPYPRLIKHWWIFYIYYPTHLALILCIKYLIK